MSPYNRRLSCVSPHKQVLIRLVFVCMFLSRVCESSQQEIVLCKLSKASPHKTIIVDKKCSRTNMTWLPVWILFSQKSAALISVWVLTRSPHIHKIKFLKSKVLSWILCNPFPIPTPKSSPEYYANKHVSCLHYAGGSQHYLTTRVCESSQQEIVLCKSSQASPHKTHICMYISL